MYFVTIVVRDRLRLLSDIRYGKVELLPAGEIVDQCWRAIATVHEGVRLDRFVVMPDHFHGLIWLDNPLTSLDQMLGGFKSATARQINAIWGRTGRGIWLRGYHDRIIRTRSQLHATRRYIDYNPLRWRG